MHRDTLDTVVIVIFGIIATVIVFKAGVGSERKQQQIHIHTPKVIVTEVKS